MKKYFVIFSISTIGLVLLLLYFPLSSNTPSPSSVDNLEVKASVTTKQVTRVAAFGDIMMHSPQIRSGAQPDGTYDFRFFFKEVKPYFASADVVVGNLELTMAGKSYPYSGYPQFNTPDEMTYALRDAGIHIVTTANNHAMDTGVEGVKRTHRVLAQAGIQSTGTAPSVEQRKAAIVKKNGATIAFLAYTQSTNGIPVPKPFLVNQIDPMQIAQDIRGVRKQGADFIFVSLHFGDEYQREPNAYQRKIAHQVLESGADVILGSHPHVVQPAEEINMNGKKKWIIYSMGNFISNQRFPYTDEGVILFFDIEKDLSSKKTILKDVSFLSTFVHHYTKWNGKRGYVVVPTEGKALPLPYPGIRVSKWKTAFDHTRKQINKHKVYHVLHLEPKRDAG